MKPTLVIDCSITMAWCFSDEGTAETARIQDRLITEAAIVPAHWFLEVANVLAIAEKLQRIAAADCTQFVELLAAFDIQADNEYSSRAFSHILPLSRAHALTSYDAAYLDLAQRRQLPLASLDGDLRRIAVGLGLEVLGK
jgi:predicted nucleic acid-binding protein